MFCLVQQPLEEIQYIQFRINFTLHSKLYKGPSKNVNIFMSVVQTVHFFRPPPPPLQVYRPTFLVSKIWVSCKTFIVQQQKLTHILSPVNFS